MAGEAVSEILAFVSWLLAAFTNLPYEWALGMWVLFCGEVSRVPLDVENA